MPQQNNYRLILYIAGDASHNEPIVHRLSLVVLVSLRNFFDLQKEQDAQLSQRDRAAGCVTVFAKSRRLELGDNILPTL